MLPEQLSNGLCSLKPDTDRLAFSVFITLDDQGNVHGARFADSVIRSRLRLSYEQAFAALQTPDGEPCAEAGIDRATVDRLKQVHRLAQAMRAQRMADGALEMDLPEVRFQLDDSGRISDVVPVENDISHQLIEECMLAANEAVCRELSRRNIPHLHRIHEAPDPEKLAELEEMFLGFGFTVGDLTRRQNMTNLLRLVHERPEAQAMYTAVLRSLRRAMYSEEPIGHYGLAKQFYTHFTSPIRRYPDLVIHRILRAVLHRRQSPYPTNKILAELGKHCSGRENIATEAERELVEIKKMRFFSEQLASGDLRGYEAVVMEVRNFGVFVHLPSVQAYGLIHVSQLSDDFFDFNPVALELKGRRTGKAFRVGDTLEVVIAKVDVDRYQLDFAPVQPPARQGKRRAGRSRDTRSRRS